MDPLTLVYIGAAIIYVIPTIVAFGRKHPNRWPICLVNLVFGGTGLGWFGALIWAMSAVHKSQEGSDGGESGLNLFVNDPQIIQVEEASSSGQSDNALRTIVNADEPGDRLLQLKRMRDAGSLTNEEYTKLRQPIIDKLFDIGSAG